MAKPPNVHAYRFRDEVALSVTQTNGETVYLTAADAYVLAMALLRLSHDVRAFDFAASGEQGATVPARRHGETAHTTRGDL